MVGAPPFSVMPSSGANVGVRLREVTIAMGMASRNPGISNMVANSRGPMISTSTSLSAVTVV